MFAVLHNRYHPHAHPLSETQVNGGAAGLLIVEDNTDLEGDIPQWASNEILLQILRLDGGNKMLTNGRSYEIFNLVANQWYRLRVSTVDPMGVSQELRFTPGCEVHKVASDGVWHSMVPFSSPPENAHRMTGKIDCIGSKTHQLDISSDSLLHELLGDRFIERRFCAALQ